MSKTGYPRTDGECRKGLGGVNMKVWVCHVLDDMPCSVWASAEAARVHTEKWHRDNLDTTYVNEFEIGDESQCFDKERAERSGSEKK